ncbi:hypothetical protein F8388_000030 [Cannabis sativa]|uniref:Uncharacterized protein n=1 Tax=Cannabis sativa TaxID=3483 RepID=A0A7J6EP72_CANSA|nr:hypothetical protein F8388_000030 [Cannabis sativa]
MSQISKSLSRELANTKKRSVDQEEEALARIQAQYDPEENVLEENIPKENILVKKFNHPRDGPFAPTKDKGKCIMVCCISYDDTIHNKSLKNNSNELSPRLISHIRVHGILLWISMGFLMPIGILLIRISSGEESGSTRAKVFFYLHLIFQASLSINYYNL